MKQFLFILFTFSAILASSQEKYISRNGSIQFIASTPLETIDPINNHVSCILDTENGNIVFQVKMISFKFEKALMEEHFNEKYVESEQFPKATSFLGPLLFGFITLKYSQQIALWVVIVFFIIGLFLFNRINFNEE